ncbi:PDZ domain-containing protein [Pelagicoccus mobilis]|uniref:PDZ domain-containing protein n=1 Tax=Pelagicoccus mobilis TaxID=415221 RepID=A0A934RWX4_9BACT|nr:M48 family metallopeptidase [Pelagicoccus mobilis]MBK1878021.1 PDZ domain-containing protein [Pelagicoccus mobilis]
MTLIRLLVPACLSAIILFSLTGCDSTEAAARKAERERKEAEEARMRAAFLARVHEAESDAWAVLQPLMQQAAGYRAEETHGFIGAVFVTEAFYSEALVEEVRAEGFGQHISVLTVFDGSPAAAAGLQGGDRLVSVNGVKVPRGQNSAVFAARKVKRLLKPGEMNQIEVARGDEILELEIEAKPSAYYGVVIDASNSVDVHVDGDVIWLGLALVEYLDDSEELPYLCAYALSKNVMRHSKQVGRNAFLGQLLDVAAAAGGVNTGGMFGSMGGAAHAHAFDIESDLIALYLLASAGYKFDTYPEYWDRVIRSQRKNGQLKSKDVERLDKMRSVIASIQSKIEAGEMVYPEEYLQGDVSELEAKAEG